MFSDNWARKLVPVLRESKLKKGLGDEYNLLVEFSGKGFDKIIKVVESNQGKLHRGFQLFPYLALELPFIAIGELMRLRTVLKVWHDAPVYAIPDEIESSLPGKSANQEERYTGKGVVIAVLDTGIHPHEDLVTPYNRILAWNDLVRQQNIPYDDNGHGTAIAGIIAGNGRASDGKIKGVAPEAWLVGVKVLDQDGVGRVSDVISGIEWCIKSLPVLNIKIINLSLGTIAQDSYLFDPLCRAVTMAWKKGITVFTNFGSKRAEMEGLHSPGINPIIISVDSLNVQQTLTINDNQLYQQIVQLSASNSSKPDLVVSGESITSLKVNDSYADFSGTLTATSLITGSAALILQKWPFYQPDRIKSLLVKKAQNLGLGRNLQGAGVLNLAGIFPLPQKKVDPPRSIMPSNTPQLLKTVIDLFGHNSLKVGEEKESFLNFLAFLIQKFGLF